MGEGVGIPQTIEEITPQWLTAALRASGVIGDESVTAVATEPLGEGAGFIGQLARITPTYDGPEAPAPKTMIAKLPALDPAARELAAMYGLYEREFRFYTELAPEISIRTAQCYYAAGDTAQVRYILLLEDLGASGRPGDQVQGCNAAEVSIALSQLARHHARWWNNPRIDEIAWLQPGIDLVNAAMTQAYPLSWEKAIENSGDRLPQDVKDVLPTLGPRITTLMEPFRDGDFTLSHGDYRLDNMFFGNPGSGYELAVLDWQSPTKGWGTYDVSYFLYGNVDIETRRAHEMDALRAYHKALTENGTIAYEFDELVEDYRASLLVSLAIWIVNVATLDTANERGKALFDLFLDRLCAAIMDHDALALLPD